MKRRTFIAVAFLVMSCSPDDGRNGATQSPPEAGEPTTSYRFCVKEFFGGTRWSGARIAVHDRDDLAPVHADELGCALLRGLPVHSELLVEVTAPGLAPYLYTAITGDVDSEYAMDVPPTEWPALAGLNFGFELDRSAGVIAVFVTDSLELRVSSLNGIAEVTPELHAGSSVGPFFNEGATAWAVADRTATTDTGLLFYFNVPPGEVEVRLALPPGLVCSIGYDAQWLQGASWPSTESSTSNAISIRSISVAGFMTNSAVRCVR